MSTADRPSQHVVPWQRSRHVNCVAQSHCVAQVQQLRVRIAAADQQKGNVAPACLEAHDARRLEQMIEMILIVHDAEVTDDHAAEGAHAGIGRHGAEIAFQPRTVAHDRDLIRRLAAALDRHSPERLVRRNHMIRQPNATALESQHERLQAWQPRTEAHRRTAPVRDRDGRR